MENNITNRPRNWPMIAVALAAAALLLALWSLWEARSDSQNLTQNVAAKIAETNSIATKTAAQSDLLAKDLRDAQNRVAQLEGKLAEFQTQRIALEEMYRNLARAPDDWLLAEIEQTLNIASRELVLAGNVKAALIALQTADQRLARADKLQVVPLRRAITQDMDMLKAMPQIDNVGISLKLDNLMSLATTLPLLLPDNAASSRITADTDTSSGNWLMRGTKDMWEELKSLVRVHDLNSGDAALLTPQQSYFLRENFKLRLLSARNDLLTRDEPHYKDDLRLATEMLKKYFDPKAKVNVNAIASLKQLSESPVSIATPDITTSLNAVRTARAARERPAKS